MGRNFRGLSTRIVLVALALGGCSSGNVRGSPASPSRFEPIGTSAAPVRPFVPTELPAGWTITSRTLRPGVPTDADAYAVFMPDGSTVNIGPALVAGFVSDEELPPYWCAMPRANPQGGRRFPERKGRPVILRWGAGLTALPVSTAFPVSGHTGGAASGANEVFVMGRDISDAVLRRAASSATWSERDDGPPTMDIPARFRLRATTDLAAWEYPARASLVLSGNGTSIYIGQERDNAAGLFFADFWRSVTNGEDCWSHGLVRTTLRGHTVIRIAADFDAESRRAMALVERGLRRVSREDYCAVLPDPTGGGGLDGTCPQT